MITERSKHWRFLEHELKAETEKFEKTFEAKAIYLLQEKQEMFVAQFLTFRKGGDMVVRFPISRNIPRKGEHLFCMLLPKQLRDYRNWGDLTYADLFKERYKGTECVSVWQSVTEDKKYSLVGFRNVELEFANIIQDTPNLILVFAPQRPPIEYIGNLQKVVENSNSLAISSILDYDYRLRRWSPELIQQDNVSEYLISQLEINDTLIIQGPPGTGKTHLIAELCSELCKRECSVMVTALTNRALMEIAEKSPVSSLLEKGRIFKSNITADEIREVPQLQTLNQVAPIRGSLILSTFYISSGFAAQSHEDHLFDYVIMDEASQALVAMFAAAKKMGKYNIWVGDVKQLSPIVELKEERIIQFDYSNLINGFEQMTKIVEYPIFQLTKSWRYAQRAANYTGLFYNNTLSAIEPNKKVYMSSLKRLVNKDGGPALVLTDMVKGDETPWFPIVLSTFLVSSILKDDSKKEIAVLTHTKKTTNALQKSINQTAGSYVNVIVDTIARVQGLTTDVVILVIPNVYLFLSLEPHLFNVATSRAREHTIIIVDKNILDFSEMNSVVHSYLETLYKDQCLYIPSSIKNKNGIEHFLSEKE